MCVPNRSIHVPRSSNEIAENRNEREQRGDEVGQDAFEDVLGGDREREESSHGSFVERRGSKVGRRARFAKKRLVQFFFIIAI